MPDAAPPDDPTDPDPSGAPPWSWGPPPPRPEPTPAPEPPADPPDAAALPAWAPLAAAPPLELPEDSPAEDTPHPSDGWDRPFPDGDGVPDAAPPPPPGGPVDELEPDRDGRGSTAELWAWLRVVGGAVLVAVLLRAVAFEAFRIPSTSMEDTLLVGDFVLVSKLHYGPRLLGSRLPGFDDPDRGEVAVFNYPPGLEPEASRRIPYIKRVVALPGDTLTIRSKEVRIGSEVQAAPREGRQLWEVRRAGPLSLDALRDLGLDGHVERRRSGLWLVEATTEQADRLRSLPTVEAVYPLVRPLGDGSAAFPAAFRFSLDDYGPIVVPRAGETVALDDLSWPVVRTVIERFEGHRAERTPSGFVIDGVPAETYTFAQDYYFVMGDNRDDSADSRTWGFVPEDHLIGKAVAVYFSWDEEAGAPRWGRIGRGVR